MSDATVSFEPALGELVDSGVTPEAWRFDCG